MNQREESSSGYEMISGIKRHTAYRIRISELMQGEYVKKVGWEPSYLLTVKGQVSRVQVLGYVVSSSQQASFLLDDGSGSILIRSFQEDLSLNIGDAVLVIGRVREWNDELFIVPEVVRKVINEKWIDVHKQECAFLETIAPGNPDPALSDDLPHKPGGAGPYETVLTLIDELDQGDGADYDLVMQKSNLKEADNIIRTLLEEGEIFQLTPGRIKLL